MKYYYQLFISQRSNPEALLKLFCWNKNCIAYFHVLGHINHFHFLAVNKLFLNNEKYKHGFHRTRTRDSYQTKSQF